MRPYESRRCIAINASCYTAMSANPTNPRVSKQRLSVSTSSHTFKPPKIAYIRTSPLQNDPSFGHPVFPQSARSKRQIPRDFQNSNHDPAGKAGPEIEEPNCIPQPSPSSTPTRNRTSLFHHISSLVDFDSQPLRFRTTPVVFRTGLESGGAGKPEVCGRSCTPSPSA